MTAEAPAAEHEALRLSVTGVVQGVGFRPFVHRLALAHGLGGWVRNEAGEVQIEIEGPSRRVRAFLQDLVAKSPPLARIDSLDVSPARPMFAHEFRIVESVDQPDRRQPVSPDVALCASCEAELFEPGDRRYRYPFVTCTDCGPRFTVIEAMPYDRERTSMRVFPQCAECLREYGTPSDRRYHSESNSCHACGPTVWLEAANGVGEPTKGAAALERAARDIREGRIVAIRGLGGFHLAVDATNEEAVTRLRRRKAREAKPLAVMVRTLEDARVLGEVGTVEEALLTSRERPIVLLRKLPDADLAPSLAPGLDTVGVMTAYTPLHQLLLDLARRPLVMTSGNLSEEPIATANDDARVRLGPIADALLLHDRDIVSRYDDSVVRLADGAPLLLRRARGYAPLPVDLPLEAPRPLLAVGPHLKNTFTLAHGRTAYVSQHIGDLENLETLEHFQASLAAFKELFRIEPEVAARDMHPGYLSTRVAAELGLEQTIEIQHHHAHAAAVAAEYGVTDRVIGVSYDGTGYGDDGAVWGAEILVCDLAGYERCCQLRYAPLPGGEIAVRRPWRVALGYLSLEPGAEGAFARAFDEVEIGERTLAAQQIERRLNAPLASSMGRLFDAAAAVLGTRRVAHYEGQAAMELEALAGRAPAEALPFPVVEAGGGQHVFDPLPLLVALGERSAAGDDVTELAARFHESVAAATAVAVRRVAEATGLSTVTLGGGVFQNARLLASVRASLNASGLRVLVPRRLSPNDGAISYGQAAVAATVMQRRS
ncbi:MAG: carbamoyltransferase HypF [Gemmatimonadota bacterium]|nr:MAG: carbamoyltransferase HypF [Gemmatimonadota bacterium]